MLEVLAKSGQLSSFEDLDAAAEVVFFILCVVIRTYLLLLVGSRGESVVASASDLCFVVVLSARSLE